MVEETNKTLSEETKVKKPYSKPEIESEKLNTYGAVCNGTFNGGRKASTAPPTPCRASRLNS
ncbi:MAG: hypothetical protein BM556_05300 [Bacteriovorax sp. MedPE-SWde]|nr:MAG: hypothetical protein BM556_05300 [Bacteriovorax sp. MedPE-SWde]